MLGSRENPDNSPRQGNLLLRPGFGLGLVVVLGLGGCSNQSATAPADDQASVPAQEAAAEVPKTPEAKDAPEVKPDEAAATAKLGETAPDFTLKDLDGTEHSLQAHRGKTVVLEWFNPECPFVKHAHGEGSLRTMAKTVAADGIVWLAINSGGPGKQGHGAEANRAGKSSFAMEHPVLLDETGEVGRRYGAEKTPHMFVIDGEGRLVYRGAIDNAPMGEIRDSGAERINYVAAALEELKSGRPVAIPESPAYGCSVKYAK